MSTDVDFTPSGLVRSFSDILQQDSIQPSDKDPARKALEDALVERVDFEDSFATLLRGATSSPRTSSQVSRHYGKLREAISAFRETFGDILQADGETKSLSWTSISDGISRMKLQHLEKSRKGFRGKAKARFHRICESIDDHSGVLKILPQEYTGPVCASVEMIVKASVNHEQMGEDFASALEEVDEIVRATHTGLALFPNNPRLQDLVAQLCCRILDFVAAPLTWYSESGGKRFRASFNENSSKEYDKHIKGIRCMARFIEQAITTCTAAEALGIRRLLEQQNDVLSRQHRELQEDRLRSKWQIDETRYAFLQQAANESNRQLHKDPHNRLLQMSMFIVEPPSNDLGQPIKEILDREAVQFVAKEREYHTMMAQETRPSDSSPETGMIAGAHASTQTILHTRAAVEEASGNLNAFFDFDRILPDTSESIHYAETDVVQRLQNWTAAPWSSFLGIFGPFAATSDNAFQQLTSSYVRAAKGANISCVSYFCELPHVEPGSKRLPETVQASAMLCALVRQMILQLPAQLPAHPQLEAHRFGSLDGTLKTWDAALCLLSDLIEAAEAPILLFAIYGLEMFEHNATRRRLVAFVEALRHHVSSSKAGKNGKTIIKVLLVTSGISQVLTCTLRNDEICDMDRGDATLKPGAARRGRTAMHDLDFGT